MENSSGNLFARANAEVAPAPIQGRPARQRQTTDIEPGIESGIDPDATGVIGPLQENGREDQGEQAEQVVHSPVVGTVEETVPQTRAVPKWKSTLGAIAGARWVLAIPGLAIAIYAGQMVEQLRQGPNRPESPPAISWILFGVAGVLLGLAAWPTKPLMPSGPSRFIGSLRLLSRWRRVLFLLPLLGSIACGAASVPLFMIINSATDNAVLAANWLANTGSWLLFIASLLLFAAAWVVWEHSTPAPEEGTEATLREDRLPRGLEWVLMVALFALALFLRVPDLNNVPPGLWFDEAYHGTVGIRLLAPGGAHTTFVPDIVHFGALYFYFLGMVTKLFGNEIWTLRILPALAGSIAVPCIYLLGSRLYGWRTGLMAGGLLAVSAWNITFSRFGMVGMFTVGLDVAVFACIAQALRTGRLGYYAVAGVMLGLASQTYYIFRVVPVVLAALFVLQIVMQRGRFVKSIRAGLLVFVLGAILASIPVDLYALQRPEDYNSRLDTVSVFSTQNSPTDEARRQNLEHNITAHAQMFNWQGDGNGRHNLSGSPMLDWITASLFLAGLAACTIRAWRWQYALPVLWFLLTLAGGVLTLPFEAPQSHRTLENSVVTTLIAGIFLGEVCQVLLGAAMAKRIARLWSFIRTRRAEARPAAAWATRTAWVLGALGLFAVIWLAGNMNYNRYFQVQAREMGVWKDMNAPQAQAGHAAAQFGSDYDVYISPVLKDAPTDYLAPNTTTRPWLGMQTLPLSPGKPKGAVLVLDLPSAADVGLIARIYPHAQFRILTAPSNPEPLVYTILIPNSDLEGGHGVQATLTEEGSNKPKSDKIITGFQYDWAADGVKAGTLRMSSTLRVDQYGLYSFALQSAAGDGNPSSILVDGYTVTAGQPITMATGLHSVVLTDTVRSGTPIQGPTRLMWGSGADTSQEVAPGNLFDPQRLQPHGLTGLYRAGTTFDSPVNTEHVDPVISFYFHEVPVPRPYTVEWSGKIYIPQAGSYTFGTENLSTSRLFIDGNEIITNNNVNSMMEMREDMTQGLHSIKVLFQDLSNASHMYLYWTPPGRPHSIIPSAFLWPEMGQYPDKLESKQAPTLEQSDGQQLPPNQLVYDPPRPQQQAVQQNQRQAGAPPPSSVDQGQGQVVPADTTTFKGDSIKPEMVLGEGAPGPGRPKAAAADSEGNIYVYGERNSKIFKYGPNGKEIKNWDVIGADGKPLTEGSGLIVKDNTVGVLDAASSNLMMFTLDGDPTSNIHLCECFFPRGVSVTNDGNFWVANTGGGNILKASPKGETIKTMGEKGGNPGQFQEPSGIWESPQGTVYVADISNKRVQSFTPDLKPLAQWDMGQSVARDGNRLTVDSDGNVLVTEYDSRAVVKYDKNGKELGRWVYRIGGNSTLIPSGIAPAGGGKFVVLYPDSDTAVVFTPGK